MFKLHLSFGEHFRLQMEIPNKRGMPRKYFSKTQGLGEKLVEERNILIDIFIYSL